MNSYLAVAMFLGAILGVSITTAGLLTMRAMEYRRQRDAAWEEIRLSHGAPRPEWLKKPPPADRSAQSYTVEDDGTVTWQDGTRTDPHGRVID